MTCAGGGEANTALGPHFSSLLARVIYAAGNPASAIFPIGSCAPYSFHALELAESGRLAILRAVPLATSSDSPVQLPDWLRSETRDAAVVTLSAVAKDLIVGDVDVLRVRCARSSEVLCLMKQRLSMVASAFARIMSQHLVCTGSLFCLPILGEDLLLEVEEWRPRGGKPAAKGSFGRVHAGSSLAFSFRTASPLPSPATPLFLDQYGQVFDSIAELVATIMAGVRFSSAQDSFLRLPNSFLLHGPAGVGKSFLLRFAPSLLLVTSASLPPYSELVSRLRLHSFPLSMPVLLANRSPSELLKIIASNVRGHLPAVIALDDLDVLSAVGEHPQLQELLPRLTPCMEQLLQAPQICMVGIIRDPGALHPSLRHTVWFERKFELVVPSLPQREALLRNFIPGSAPALTAKVAKATSGYVARDLKRLVVHAQSLVGSGVLGTEDLLRAKRAVPASQLQEYHADLPEVTWDDIGGCEEVKQYLKEFIEWPTQHAATIERLHLSLPSGVLLYGPSGCGKTLCVHALANHSTLNFIAVKGPEMFSKYLGDTEKYVRNLFSKARKLAPCIVFFDELDAIGGLGNDGAGGVAERVLTQLLTEMDGIQDKKRVFVIGCTNRPDLIDSALLRPGRLDALLFVKPPDAAARLEILRSKARKTPFAADVDLARLAPRLDHFSGADVASLCREAALEALAESPDADQICQRHVDAALAAVSGSVSAQQLSLYEGFAKSHLVA